MKRQKLEKQFIKVYDEYADAVFRYCLYRVYNREKAQDVMQEAFTRTWNYLANGQEVQNLRAFIYRTARNLIIDDSRRKKELSLEALQENGFEPEVKASQIVDVQTKELFENLEKLAPNYREVIILQKVEGFSVKEIAKILKTPENLVSVRIHRAMKKLRALF